MRSPWGAISATTAAELAKLDDDRARAEVAQVVVEQRLTRGEVEDLVKAVRARRPAPAPRPDPVTIEVEPGITVTVRWKKAGGPDEVQVLRKALKLAQERRRHDQAA